MQSICPNLHSSTLTIRAGAGTGKTTAMVEYVLKLLQDQKKKNSKYPALVVTTFTRKATQELKERILHRALEIEDPELLQFIQRSSRLHISTIHGVLVKYLSQFADLLGLPPAIGILKDSEVLKIRRRTVREILRGETNEVQQALSSLLEELDWKTLWLLFDRWSELKINRENAQSLSRSELLEKLESQMKELVRLGHEVLERVSREETTKAWLQYCELLQLCLSQLEKTGSDVFQWRQAFLQFVENRPLVRKTKSSSETTMELKDEFHSLLKSLSSFAWEAEFIERFEEVHRNFSLVMADFERRSHQQKRDSGLLTMGDLETYSIQLLRQHPETAVTFSQQWDHWMVDEYQDTSPRQVEILEGLSQGKTFFTVGDPQQSIYLFRGARTEVFERRLELTRQSGGELRTLMTNYRSAPLLLEFVNQFFTHFNSAFAAMDAGREPVARATKPVLIWTAGPDFKEFNEVAAAQRVQELLLSGVQASEICILGSTNGYLDEISQRLAEMGIVYQRSVTDQFANRREVRTACALLRFLLNPHDNINLVELLRSHYFSIKDLQIMEVAQKANGSFWSVFLEKQPSHSDILKLSGLRQKAAVIGITAAWEEALQNLSFFDEALAMDPSGEQESCLWRLVSLLRGQERRPGFSYLDFLNQMSEGAEAFEQELNDVAPARRSDRVQLMTVHASKGLQFNHVILPFLGREPRGRNFTTISTHENSSRFALSILGEDGSRHQCLNSLEWAEEVKLQERQERDRLLYVAMTRARESISLIWNEARGNSWAARFPGFSDPQWENFVELRSSETGNEAGRVELPAVNSEESNQPGVNDRTKAVRAPWAVKAQSDILKNLKRTMSVTELIEKTASSPKGSIRGDQLLQRLNFASEGTELHRWFENLKYSDNFSEALAEWPEQFAWVRDFKMGLIPQLIQSGEVESGFVLRLENTLLQGKIDLWGKDSNGVCWLIDYKSGAFESRSKALKQLEYYSLALRRVGKISLTEKVMCLPLYLRHPDQSIPSEARSVDLLLAEVKASLAQSQGSKV